MPSRIDCGRISSAASGHLTQLTRSRRCRAPAARVSKAKPVAPTKTGWKPSASTPIDALRPARRRAAGCAAAASSARAQPGAERHAAHEDRQHQRLRVGGVAEEELEVVRPDRLVDQAGEAREREDGEKRLASDGTASGRLFHGGDSLYKQRSMPALQPAGRYLRNGSHEAAPAPDNSHPGDPRCLPLTLRRPIDLPCHTARRMMSHGSQPRASP